MFLSKLDKAIDSINRAKNNYLNGEKNKTKSDMYYVKENVEEAIYLLLAEIELDNEQTLKNR